MSTILGLAISVIALALAYIRFRAYVDETQRDFYEALEGRNYPRFSSEINESENIELEVVNADVDFNWFERGTDDWRFLVWRSLVVLKPDVEEFPWDGENLENYDLGPHAPSFLNPPSTKNVDSLDELMKRELYKMCGIHRQETVDFAAEFFQSAYGPAIMLSFRTKDLFLITEHLEAVATVTPTLFNIWKNIAMGTDTDAYLEFLNEVSDKQDVIRRLFVKD